MSPTHLWRACDERSWPPAIMLVAGMVISILKGDRPKETEAGLARQRQESLGTSTSVVERETPRD